jgi:energy-coupling factor transporter ATP-binding protein EcfA2/uncharacterized protein YukE
MLSGKIQGTVDQISGYEEQEKTEEAENEENNLNELKDPWDEVMKPKNVSYNSLPNNKSKVRELKEKLDNGLAKIHLQNVDELIEKIQNSEKLIDELEKQERKEEVQNEIKFLRELQELRKLWEEIRIQTSVELMPNKVESSIQPILAKPSNDVDVIPFSLQHKKRSYLENLSADLAVMPSCARKTTMELIVHFEQRLLGDFASSEKKDSVISSLQTLHDQIKREKLLSEKVKSTLRDLETHKTSDNCSSIVRYLEELLRNIRFLNVPEIQRLVTKAKEAAESISGKEIILLVGETGSGKSTTIQFLAGSTMKETRVEIAKGKFLNHITAVGPVKNPELCSITCSPLNKSETRYIASVTIQLKDILGPHDNGVIILCDAPGFDDTAGPEVDIANSIGVVEALKGTKSVKILALSSYKSVGDRGQGIQKLAHILINMVHGIEDKLDAIFYAFTKYPENEDINASLLDIKTAREEEDPTLRSDSAFMIVLSDMIEKTEDNPYIIDPIHGKPKLLIKQLKHIKGIMHPGEVFRCSMGKQTRDCIANHVQNNKSSIECAMKHKDHDLVLYYLNDLKILKNLIKENFIGDAYQESICFITENVSEYCTKVMREFNRALISQDGLKEDDIRDYKASVEYLQHIQILKEHLESLTISPAMLIANISSTLQEISLPLMKEDLHSPSVEIFLNNLYLLKNSFKELEMNYTKICEKFKNRFEELVQSARDPILANDFNQIAEIILNISKSLHILKKHFDGQIEEMYQDTVKLFLQRLNTFSEEIDSLLPNINLQKDHLDIIKNNFELLKSAKENAALQDRISTYMNMLKTKNEISDQFSVTRTYKNNCKDLNEIYNEFVMKLIKYIEDISIRIQERFKRSGGQALKDIEKLVEDMDAIRTIPEIKSRTAEIYYNTAENIRHYMHDLLGDTEKLLTAIDQPLEMTDYRPLARTLSHWKKAKWINRISPEIYEDFMHRITEQLVEYVHQLKDSLFKLDLTLKYPENISLARTIIDKIKSMKILETDFPELKQYIQMIFQGFLQRTKIVFDTIQKDFNLSDKRLYQETNTDRNISNPDVEDLKTEQTEELEATKTLKLVMNSKMNHLNSIMQTYDEISYPTTETSEVIDQEIFQEKNSKALDYLKKHGYQSIDDVTETFLEVSNRLQTIRDKEKQLNDSLNHLKSISKKNDLLLSTRSFNSSTDSRQNNSFTETYQPLNHIVQKKNDKKSYHFRDKLPIVTLNNALIYIKECEKVDDDCVKENAGNTYDILHEYINEYGHFLNEEIKKNYKNIINNNTQDDCLQYSEDLEKRLHELSSLSKFPYVFECIDGTEKFENWQREFLNYYQSLSAQIKEYKVSGKTKELRDQIYIMRALTCVDRFCGEEFATNGFRVLCNQCQEELIKGSQEAYKIILEYILMGDYVNVDRELSRMDNKSLHLRDSAHIQHNLQDSLNKLMTDTESIVNFLDGKIEKREYNQDNLKEIKENMEKIRITFNKQNIRDHLDEKTKIRLQNFDRTINKILCEIILRTLKSIEAFLGADSFYEAGQTMESLTKVQHQLDPYYSLEYLTKKTNELKERLSNILNEIFKRNDFTDINTYSLYPPKDILAKLKIGVEHGNAQFTLAYNSILERIRLNFNLAIENIRNAPLNESETKIRSLNYALYFLPEDLQTQFKLQIDDLSKSLAEKERKHRHNLEKLFTDVDKSEHLITEIGSSADLYTKQNMHELLEILREQTIKKLYMYRTHIQNFLDEKQMQPAVDILKKIFLYEEHLSIVSEVKEICVSIRELTIHFFSNCSGTLINISFIEHTQIVEKAFTNMIIYFNFSGMFDKKTKELLPKNVLDNAIEGFQNMFEYLYANSKQYQDAIREINILLLYITIEKSKNWELLLQMIKQSDVKHDSVQTLKKNIEKILSYTDMISLLQNKINHLKSQLNVELISDETARFDKNRDEFFSNLMTTINVLTEIKLKFEDILTSTIDIEMLKNELRKKIEIICKKLLDTAAKEDFSRRDADNFRKYYNHLLSIEKYIRLPELNIRHVLEQSEDKIFERVTSLRKQIQTSNSDVKNVSNILIKLKFLAENLSMFDSNINTEIDEVLKNYRGEQNNLGITNLAVELEKTEEGSRLISEHSCLSGEDRRKRREKMQKQDDLEYVLERLTGDDIDKKILRSRYEIFKIKYDELVSSNLNLLDSNTNKEADLQVLVTQTKLIVGTGTQTSNSITWKHSFKEQIPELLAYIFAIWTLQNTQHYNTTRGLEAAQFYLLMPHIGQIIAIFRLLGVGYDMKTSIKKSDNSLINNLVEVGTGEGKSVVMAITACVFALTGVDVNCSCYSEVLSTRDKNDFASVFRVLGIEKNIEYGTFNRLCENLLNEQCNIREKVRDMIVNNTSTLVEDEVKTGLNSKVLLIDEVDVFLSEKFYGGIYTPSVYLKDPSIKALLDTIWENKPLRTLNSVKILPAYKICATKYSNWIFLFDEAIKDMLAALQSFQSSTYIVQNDKIVYVEGESIVDNVARGYDTVWAYYYEQEKGKISVSSLDANVGIIINCGTFSYAEMPHDFAYIGGVTGTLKTLAKPEKEILKRVYSIDKTTFMPSVFGSSNRTYNPQSDVRVVKDSEYFMEIRGEIDVICNARRAILVFFESEEKLLEFHNSSELSTIKHDVEIIMEKVPAKDRKLYIERATTIGKVTLLTRTFGRGTDFICRNQQLLANGGVHVLQTFFSEELSEEYQIMGRGARQGDRGSYRMILSYKDLEWVLGAAWKEELPKIIGPTLYETLNTARNTRYESKCGAKDVAIEQCKRDHKASKDFLAALSMGNMETVKQFLNEQNKGANLIVTSSSRTVLLMDATGSMSSLLCAAKETVCSMFERASTVLKEKGLPNDAFQMQFVVYRDYDCKEDGLLQSSSWETKPSNLRSFMTNIAAQGGDDYEEAIEIGLWHAVQQSKQPDGISQVILIGDAPAKGRSAIQKDREANGDEPYWSKTKFSEPTHYTDELQKLKDKEIPVHAFYLTEGAQSNFQEIAHKTGGRCELLDINSSKGAESLTHFVTEEVLRIAAGPQGDSAVELYRAKYVNVKTTFTS